MKVGRFAGADGGERIGVVLDHGTGLVVLDLGRAAAALAPSATAFGSMAALIDGGRPALADAYAVGERARRSGESAWFTPVDAVRWLIPVEPRDCLCAGRNFGKHRDESLAAWSRKGVGGIHFEFPTGFVKRAAVLVPHRAEVRRPPEVEELDYEVELAAVIGRPIDHIAEREALGAVFGYTVFNDLSARDWQRREMQNQTILIGKNFPGFGPLGPWVLTADEVEDPQQLVLELRVNGKPRQHARATEMIFGVAALVSFWSRIGLQAGDVVASGTPDGVALHHKPDPFEWYLRAGDRVEAEIDRIGVLETIIV